MATLKVNVKVGVPEELFIDKQALVPPPFPANPANAAALVVQDEPERFGSRVVGGPV